MSTPSAGRDATIRVATGPRLHYQEYGDPAGEPIVFVHGWPDSWFSFSRVLPLLPASRRAVAFDQRGFGDSERPDGGYAIPEMGADVIALLDALGIQRAALVGHSFGSFVARRAALTRPERVTALVLIGTGFSTATPVTRELELAVRDLPDPIPESFAREFQSSTAHRPVPPEFFDGIIAESLKLPPRLWRQTLAGLVAYDDTAELSRLAVPTRLLWGDRDALFSREEQERFLAAVPAATVTVYEDTGHCPNWELPERVAADIAAHVGA